MSSNLTEEQKLILGLYENGVVQFGSFTLKSGIQSPFYVDLRRLVSNPSLLLLASECLWKKVAHLDYDVICGVPYGAIGLAGAISVNHGKSLIMKRKQAKKHGTKKIIEGVYQKGSTCLLVEDLITSGTSILETAYVLEQHDLKVRDTAVVVDRLQGGRENLARAGYNLHSVVSIREILDLLAEKGLVPMSTVRLVDDFLAKQQVSVDVPGIRRAMQDQVSAKPVARPYFSQLPYEERAKLAKNSAGRRLLETMARKKTNLCFSADVASSAELLRLADAVGPHICMLKTHIDILTDFSEEVLVELQALARKHDFIIFEDRKFADIGNTVKLQYTGGVHHPSTWADVVNAHVVAGPGVVSGLQAGAPAGRGLILLAEMSSKENMLDMKFIQMCRRLAREHRGFVMGFISQGCITSEDPGLVHMTPGINVKKQDGKLGQQYNTPQRAIMEMGSDVIIVGGGIYRAADPVAAARQIQQMGWEAYEQRLLVSLPKPPRSRL